MENVSKALLIAGAILLAILIISIGIMVFNSSKGTATQAEQLGGTIATAIGNSTEQISKIEKDHQSEVSNKPLISFTIGDIPLKAEVGMSWSEWIASEYNKIRIRN